MGLLVFTGRSRQSSDKGETRRQLTCHPLIQFLLFLALFIGHLPPEADAYTGHLKLRSVKEKGSDLARPPLDFRVLQEVPGESSRSKEQMGWKRRRRRRDMMQAAAVEGSQDDRPGTEPASQMRRVENAARNNSTRTSTALSSRAAHFCPSCTKNDEFFHADDNVSCGESWFDNNQNLRFNVCFIPTVLCPFLPKDDPERLTLSLPRLPTAETNVNATVVGETTDPMCLTSTVHNSSFSNPYDMEFDKSCHDFICKLQMLSEAPVDHGYVEHYYEHPGPLSANDTQCMEMARRNGALYHENRYLHMLSVNTSKTLTIFSVISYKSPPKVPFHELAFLLLREEKYECIEELFRLVTGRVEGKFGSIYLTGERVICDKSNNNPFIIPKLDSSFYRMWLKVIEANPVRIVSVALCGPWIGYDLIALLIQGPLRVSSSTVYELEERQSDNFLHQGQPVVVFKVLRDVLMGHPLVTENKNTLHCTFYSGFTVCRANPATSRQFTFLFINGCTRLGPINWNPLDTILWEWDHRFHSFLVGTEAKLNLCSIDSPPFCFRFYLGDNDCYGSSYYLIDHGENQSVMGSQVIHPFTYFRVYYLGSYLRCYYSRSFKVVEWEKPYLLFNENGIELREVFAQLEERFKVNELSLFTDSKYKWSVHANIHAALYAIHSGEPECLHQMMRGISIIYEEDANRYITGAVKNKAFNPCCYVGVRYISQRIGLVRNNCTVNLFWPSCGNLNSLVITNQTVTSEWHYLSTGCRITQVVFMLITAFITAVTIGGNSFVLYIIHKFRMWEIKRYGPAFFILCSLAVADLLSGVFPGTLAVLDQLLLMTGHLTLKTLDKDLAFELWRFDGNVSDKFQSTASLRDVRFERGGYAMFCSYVLSVSSIVSLLMLFLLSVERYRGVTNVFSPCLQIVGTVSMSWIVAFVLGILLFIREDGFHSAGFFDPISKLTVSTAQSGYSPSIIVFSLQVLFAGGFGSFMIFITFFTFYIFVKQRKDREKNGTTAHPSRNVVEEEIKCFIIFFIMMALYLVSCLPLAILTLFGLSEVAPLMKFFAWWLFMAGGSWNWYIYTYRRGQFRRNLQTWITGKKRRRATRRELKQSIEMQQRMWKQESINATK